MADSAPILAKVTDKTIRKARAADYPKQVWYFIAVFIFLVAVSNVVSRLFAVTRRRSEAPRDVEGAHRSVTSKISYRRLPAAIVNAFRMVAFRTVIPLGGGFTINLAEAFITATYIIILFVWSLINTTTLAGKKYDPTYYANRAGNIAAVQTPLIVALAMKNNPISFITGISFDKLNYLHRMCSRTICILLWVHAGGRLTLGLSGDTSIKTAVLRWGIVAIVALTLLCIVSIRPARQLEYEYFLIGHFLLVFFFLLGGLIHAKHFDEGSYLWPSFLLWALDRFIRFVRVVIFNHSYFGFKSGLGTFDATVEPVAPGYVRLRFRRPKHLHWSPGQSAYLTMPGVSQHPFEAHPFTMANADISHKTSDATAAISDTGLSEKDKANADMALAATGKDIVFLVNAKEGFTKRLRDIASSSGTLKVFLDGPYGTPPSVHTFDSAVLIAGGSGITFTMPILEDLVHRACHKPLACRNVTFIWVIRHVEHIDMIYEDLKKVIAAAPESLSVDIRIFITNSTTDLVGSEEASIDTQVEQGEKGDPMSRIMGLPRTKVEKGRPDVPQLLDEVSATARGRMTVNVCGPYGLANSVRGALCTPSGLSNILHGGPSVELYIEAFGFA
ncbi:hypothetical protein DENSPDRAFT_179747 [Dentipellis sp. KUC8613]|nr:hypothetical protein DENSPDRAFT_179747 [Dentipellis sp. KUC8613]